MSTNPQDSSIPQDSRNPQDIGNLQDSANRQDSADTQDSAAPRDSAGPQDSNNSQDIANTQNPDNLQDSENRQNSGNLQDSHNPQDGGEPAKQHEDPFRKTCLVPYVDPDTAPPAVQAKLKVLPFRRNIFYLLGHSHGLFPHLAGVIGGCFDSNTRKIPLLDWQLIVLRTATTLGAKYEYDVNLPVAEVYEMPQEKIDAMGCSPDDIRSGQGPWTDRDRLILRVVDEQLKTYTNEPQTIKDALEVLSTEELVEVLIILGTYALIARVINGLKIDDDPPIPGLKDMLRKAVK